MTFLVAAAAFPALFWNQGTETAGALKRAGIDCVRVPQAREAEWKGAGVCVAVADPKACVRLPAPGVQYRTDVASASRAPWVDSNGWRILRNPGRTFFYSAPKGKAALSAVEAFAFGAEALVDAQPSDLPDFGRMLAFLKRAGTADLPALANIGFVDDGSPAAGEVMNLLIRRNLVFRIVAAPDPKLDLNVQLGTPDYPRAAAANPAEMVAAIRQKLTDSKRLLRVYGSEVVIGRMTGDDARARLHLVNYSGRKIEGLRVRVRGIRRQVDLLMPSGKAAAEDLEIDGDATEFTVPEMQVYAIADLR